MLFQLPKLQYAYNALEPYIDETTMRIHHTKHHAAYTDNLNKAIDKSNFVGFSIEKILEIGLDNPAIRNNGGGFYNHNFFWKILNPSQNKKPYGIIEKAINYSFGSFENFKKEFTNVSMQRFGSGWIWLCLKDNKLLISSTPNQDNPLMSDSSIKGFPIIALDVWEHAYYLKYQNRRLEYINAFWQVINWDQVINNYNTLLL